MIKLGFVDSKGQIATFEVLGNQITRVASISKGIPMYTTLEGLKFNISGIVEEFPDLKDKPIDEIKREGLKRFRKHLSKFKTEEATIEYIKKDLTEKHGFKLIMVQRHGHRPQRVG